jgi:hypothetical protein
MSDITGT